MAEADGLKEVARLRVIYGDTDQMGMVYYANYLRYFEVARNELLRQVGLPYRRFEETEKLRLPVVEANVRYRRPARYDDEIAIHAAVPEVARASVKFLYAIRRVSDGEELVTGHTVHACVDAGGKLARLPDGLRQLLARQASTAARAVTTL